MANYYEKCNIEQIMLRLPAKIGKHMNSSRYQLLKMVISFLGVDIVTTEAILASLCVDVNVNEFLYH